MITRAAGILLVDPTGCALFLKRGPAGDLPGYWCFPGGGAEAGETAEDTAKRETEEETGVLPKGTRQVWTRAISGGTTGISSVAAAELMPAPAPDEGVDFTTFLQRVPEQFVPTLNDEHTGYAWAKMDAPPEPLHPGCRTALARFNMDETAVARCIASGELTSPQRMDNMWLFALRITGTGTAYRKKHDEYVYRAPENYLTPEFLARCNGLPVIFEHPVNRVLNSKEFNDRVVGTILLPYIAGDEVWGIARIYDEATAKILERDKMSTSPSVAWRDPSVNSKVELEDGSKLLIEGKPSLLDHLAICSAGVWDKGGEPSGVAADSTGDAEMTDAEKKAAEDARKAEIQAAVTAALAARADDGGGAKLDKVLSALDSFGKRLDAYDEKEEKAKAKADADEKEKGEKAKADKAKADAAEAEEKDKKEKADKAKADADEKEKDEKAKADKAKADAAAASTGAGDLAARVKALEAGQFKPLTDADYAAMADAQAEADSVFSLHGGSAPRPLQGETIVAYKRRCAVKMKDHSETWKGIGLEAVADSAFEPIYQQIRSDATKAGLNPRNVPENQLREIVQTDTTGRKVTSFAGQPSAWMGAFASNRRRLVGIKQGQR